MSVDLIIVGSLAYDVVETPFHPAETQLGGSAVYMSLASLSGAAPGIVGVVGDDFALMDRALMEGHGVDLDGLHTRTGKTFRWGGRYDGYLKERDTLFTELGVFADFTPEVPAAWRDAPYVFLGNIDPDLQISVLDQMNRPAWVGCDTMNFWIEGKRDTLDRLLPRVDALVINDSEAALLTGERNMAVAGGRIQEMGPGTVIIKRGEFGALVFSAEDLFAAPAMVLDDVVDPTGAGDSFAGGMMAAICRAGDTCPATLRRAVAAGTVIAGACCQGFGPYHLADLTREDVNARLEAYAALVRLPAELSL
ncbi:MAG: PfkB family carbohydrate kinase [Pseudomonadota bacterium]